MSKLFCPILGFVKVFAREDLLYHLSVTKRSGPAFSQGASVSLTRSGLEPQPVGTKHASAEKTCSKEGGRHLSDCD